MNAIENMNLERKLKIP